MLMRRFGGTAKCISILLAFVLICAFYTEYSACPKQRSVNQQNKPSYKLIIVVISEPKNSQERETIRRTWLYEEYKNVRYFFVVGTLSVDSELLESLNNEEKTYQDLLLLDDLRDSYESLTKKVIQSFSKIYKDFDFKFLLKCDDDSFVVLDKVLKELDKWERDVADKELYWGFFNGKAQVKRNGPWKETDWILCDFYLPYALGGGYVLSNRLVRFIAENSDVLKIYNSEDVSVGLWLAPLSNVERKHDVRFDTEYRSRGCSNDYIITHKQSPENMKTIYQTYKATGALCLKEVRHRNSYRYDWSVPPSKCCNRLPGIP